MHHKNYDLQFKLLIGLIFEPVQSLRTTLIAATQPFSIDSLIRKAKTALPFPHCLDGNSTIIFQQ